MGGVKRLESAKIVSEPSGGVATGH